MVHRRTRVNRHSHQQHSVSAADDQGVRILRARRRTVLGSLLLKSPVASGVAVAAAMGSAGISGGLLIYGHHISVLAAGPALAGMVAMTGVILTRVRGPYRDGTYRSAVTALTADGKMNAETLTAMAIYEAIASGQLDSADIAAMFGPCNGPTP
jgi:hypothetical protein